MAALKGIFYSEFDNVAGPVILFQYPEGTIPAEVFDGISDFVIIHKDLCERVITLCTDGLKVMGYPVVIENEKYHRNTLSFNIGFVFSQDDQTTDSYTPLLRKLGQTFKAIEKEEEFLFNENTKEASIDCTALVPPSSSLDQKQLDSILPKIFQGLSSLKGECILPLNRGNILALKLFSALPSTPEPADWEVPCPTVSRSALLGRLLSSSSASGGGGGGGG
eukprot:CAMPEP_0194670098 /NCGR_PEP_ID=MMETSP0295-20121207/4989_1 /TAXON_ID=39354 /ORGANISM="Heterosigma akashiwo, Strain CCMP2393" /LENGTH=220 /DNA_ID=CAMNT_0039553235 /DNA_START=35 /DNA_END=694 /DNA_ORIENTATION=+